MPTRALLPHEPGGLSEVVDVRTGTVRAAGRLTAQGADLLRGTVETLRRSGHERVLLDLREVDAADEAGLRVLHDVVREMAAGGGRLVLGVL